MTSNTEHPWWDDRTKCAADIIRDVEMNRTCDRQFGSPKAIYNYFDENMYGCHEYKKALATAVWSSRNLGTKTNFLVVGPSGCGKTELARILKKIYYNTVIFDATSVSPVSYKGNATISECLLEVDFSPKAPPPWIFIDEIDKAVQKKDGLGEMIMNELLKMMEGGKCYAGPDEKNRVLVNTSRINFVFMGTFETLKKERRNAYGFTADTSKASVNSPVTRENLYESSILSNEFLGRINGGIIEVEPMDEAKAERILADERYSPVKRLEQMYDVHIELSEGKRKELLSMTSKFGVRGVYSELQSRINDALFEDCRNKTITI